MTYFIPRTYPYYYTYPDDNLNNVRRCETFLNNMYQNYKISTYSIDDYDLQQPHYLDTSYYCNSFTDQLINYYEEMNKIYYYLYYDILVQYILLYGLLFTIFSYRTINYFNNCENTSKAEILTTDSSDDTSNLSSSESNNESSDISSNEVNHNNEYDDSDSDMLNNMKNSLSIDKYIFEYYPLTILLRQFADSYEREVFCYLDSQNGFMEIVNYFIFNQESKFTDDNNNLISTKIAYQNIKLCFNENYFNNDTNKFNYLPIRCRVDNNTETKYTNFGHLNFIHWIYYSGIYQYVIEHRNDIIDLMLKDNYITNETAKKYLKYKYFNLKFKKIKT